MRGTTVRYWTANQTSPAAVPQETERRNRARKLAIVFLVTGEPRCVARIVSGIVSLRQIDKANQVHDRDTEEYQAYSRPASKCRPGSGLGGMENVRCLHTRLHKAFDRE